MMITISILGVLLAIAIPSFSRILERQRLKGVTEQFTTMIHLIKTEAPKRNQLVYINAIKTSDSAWSLQAATATTCTLNSNCDLKSITSDNTSNILLTSDLSTLNGSSFNPSRSLPSFSTSRSITFSTNNYSVTSTISPTGLITQCSTPSFGGYIAC